MNKKVKALFEQGAAGGIVLFLAALAAIIFQNGGFRDSYQFLIHVPIEIRIGEWALAKPLYLWVNDLLMSIFFLLVGLEVKREIIEGELSSPQNIILPGIAALGGMIVPAGCFYFFNKDIATNLDGWAIPTATDIAFSLGVLAILGSRIPSSLKIFLTTLAIFDDLGAIIVIALFYTDSLSELSLGLAGIFSGILFVLNRVGVSSRIPYMFVGLLLWLCVLKSGIHATLAGVVVALAIPFKSDRPEFSPLKHLEHALHPWVSFLILPLFAFVNAGLDFALLSLESLTSPISLGIIVGLFFGKQLGVFLFSFVAIKLGYGRMPSNANMAQLYGVSIITGIGFTMSLFIGSLAYNDLGLIEAAKTGTIVGSALAGIFGLLVLGSSSRRQN